MENLLTFFMFVIVANVVLCQKAQVDELTDTLTTSRYYRPPTPVSTDECIRLCPSTSEYNPVCGSDGELYFNPGRLMCATECGVVVFQLGPAPCSMYDDTTERVGTTGPAFSGPENVLDRNL